MRSLTIAEVLETYQRIMQQSGGLIGIHDMGALESALGFSIIQNHPFIDGNKSTGHAAMAMFLAINGYKINASIDEQYEIILSVASGKLGRDRLAEWLANYIQEFP